MTMRKAKHIHSQYVTMFTRSLRDDYIWFDWYLFVCLSVRLCQKRLRENAELMLALANDPRITKRS